MMNYHILSMSYNDMTSPWMKITISNQKFHPCTKEIETLIDKDEQSKIYEIFF